MGRTTIAKSGTRSKVSSGKRRRTTGGDLSSGGLIATLPSGESLAEFALRFGFLAPSLLGDKQDKLDRLRRLR